MTVKTKAEDKIKAPNCPTCGRFMDKLQVRALKQLAKGTVTYGTVAVGWICPSPKCQKIE